MQDSTNATTLPRWRRSVLAVALACGLVSCGRPATEQDCERILTRITELELAAAHVSAPEEVEAQVQRTKRAFDEATRKECVGRRISDETLRCVEKATTGRQVVDECFN